MKLMKRLADVANIVVNPVSIVNESLPNLRNIRENLISLA